MNIVTYETAQKLKEAGFPQPGYEKGQFWYDADGEIFVAIGLNQDGNVKGTYLQKSGYFGGCNTDSTDVFAPTATDILRQLGVGFQIYRHGNIDAFVVLNEDAPGVVAFHHENPAEAAARTYLSIYEKQPTK